MIFSVTEVDDPVTEVDPGTEVDTVLIYSKVKFGDIFKASAFLRW